MVKSGDFLAKLPANSKPKPVFFSFFSHKKTRPPFSSSKSSIKPLNAFLEWGRVLYRDRYDIKYDIAS
jgi:hypothetical protein